MQTYLFSMKYIYFGSTTQKPIKLHKNERYGCKHIFLNEIKICLALQHMDNKTTQKQTLWMQTYFTQWNLVLVLGFTRQKNNKTAQKQKLCTLHILVNEMFVTLPDNIWVVLYNMSDTI